MGAIYLSRQTMKCRKDTTRNVFILSFMCFSTFSTCKKMQFALLKPNTLIPCLHFFSVTAENKWLKQEMAKLLAKLTINDNLK